MRAAACRGCRSVCGEGTEAGTSRGQLPWTYPCRHPGAVPLAIHDILTLAVLLVWAVSIGPRLPPLLLRGSDTIRHAGTPQCCISRRLLGIGRLGSVAAAAVARRLPAACCCLLHRGLLLRGQVVLQCALKGLPCERWAAQSDQGLKGKAMRRMHAAPRNNPSMHVSFCCAHRTHAAANTPQSSPARLRAPAPRQSNASHSRRSCSSRFGRRISWKAVDGKKWLTREGGRKPGERAQPSPLLHKLERQQRPAPGAGQRCEVRRHTRLKRV